MMTLIKVSMFVTCYLAAASLNPVKTAMSILVISSMTFIYMFLEKGVTWFPWLFLMLFMGGVLIIFLILSSISPNEKSKKLKKMDWMMITILSLTFILTTPITEGGLLMYQQLKWFYQMSASLTFITMTIALYFFMFVTMLTEDKASMRTELC